MNRIPLGGFCSLEGDDPSQPDTFHAKDSFITAKLWKKLTIILGGVAVNILTAWVVFTLLFRHGTQPLGISPLEESESYLIPHLSFLEKEGFVSGGMEDGVLIQEVAKGSLARDIGLQVGDVITQINNHVSLSIENLPALLAQAGALTGETFIAWTNEAGSQELHFTCPSADCKL